MNLKYTDMYTNIAIFCNFLRPIAWLGSVPTNNKSGSPTLGNHWAAIKATKNAAKDSLHESFCDAMEHCLQSRQYEQEAKQPGPEQHRQAHPQARVPGRHGAGGSLG